MSKKENKSEDNYYSLLELSHNCTKSDIDTAYRRLAVRWHPDKNRDDKEVAEKKFRDISKAYQILSDDNARSNYDKHGVTTSNGTGDNLFDPYEMFKGIFETEDNQIPNVIIKIEADIINLYTGFTETVKFTRFSQCNKCESTGTQNKKSADCVNCSGRGVLLETVKGGKVGFMINEKQCSVCEGNGINPDAKLCRKCSGNKYIKDEIECEVDVPPGAYDNYYIKLEEEGNYIPKEDRKTKSVRTDVIVVIKEQMTDNLSKYRRGMFIKEINRINLADILLTVNISFGESIVGVKKEIDFLAGETIGIDIDEIIYNGDIHVIKNMGMPLVPEEIEKINKSNKNNNQSTNNQSTNKLRGDLFLLFKVDKPLLSKQKRNRIWQIITDTPYPDEDDMDEIVHPTLSLNIYIDEHKSLKKEKVKRKQTSNSDVSDNSNNSNASSDSIDTSIDETNNNYTDDNSDSSSTSDANSDSNSNKKRNNQTRSYKSNNARRN